MRPGIRLTPSIVRRAPWLSVTVLTDRASTIRVVPPSSPSTSAVRPFAASLSMALFSTYSPSGSPSYPLNTALVAMSKKDALTAATAPTRFAMARTVSAVSSRDPWTALTRTCADGETDSI